MVGVVVGFAGAMLPASGFAACVINADCNDNKPCTFDLCVFGNCLNTPDDSLCQDSSGCNGDEVCNPTTGQCSPGTPVDCGVGLTCIEWPTVPFYQCFECSVSADCDDGVFCNGPETCVAGGCQPGVQPNCNPPDPCVDGFCNLQTDQCQSLPTCFDNDLCTVDDCLTGSSCVHPPNYPSTHCCNPATGQLTVISDGIACTTDACNFQTGQVTHLGQACNDGNTCTINDHLDCNQGGACVGTNVNTLNCTKDSDCPIGFCKSTTGKCSCTTCTTDPQCNDSRACTTDICDIPPGVCRYTTSDAACANGLFCNQQVCNRDVGCVAAAFCTPTGGNPCTTAASCQEASDNCGGCQPPTVAIGGSRYLLITANAANAASHALAIKGDCTTTSGVSCLNRYVDFDNPVNPNDPKAARLVTTAVSKTAATWGQVKLRATEIRPGVKYYVYTECSPGGGGAVRSAGVPITLWPRGDTNGDGVTNFVDIGRLVSAFQALFNAGLTLEQTDLVGVSSNDCRPNRAISFLDIADDVAAFQLKPFPCSAPCMEP